MRVLVGCEFSGVVRNAFRKRGHDAWSCDLSPTDSHEEFHYQHDVREVAIGGRWDLMIAHPPCTYLCSSGLHWNKRTLGRTEKTEAALQFVRFLMEAPINRIAIENPVGCIGTRIRPADQKIQPWMFGEDASKGTCLWLKNLPSLKHTIIVPPHGYQVVKFAGLFDLCDCCEEPWCDVHQEHYGDCCCIGPTQDDVTYKTIDGYEFGTKLASVPHPIWANQTPSGQNKLGPSEARAMERSRTYQGIADAMAEQWGID